MRIRSTKPEFWRSRTVSSVPWDARLVLKGLESYVDDNGVGKDDLALIVGDVFPRDMVANPRDTLARVSEAISDLHQAGLVWRYEVDGRALIYISSWEEIQRIDKPGKGRLPRPDGTFDFRESVIRESVASPREGLAPGTGEQGNRGTGEKNSSSPATPPTPTPPPTPTSTDFDTFWEQYPRKVGKQAAAKAYTKARRTVPAAKLLLAARKFAADPNREQTFTPHPATWLNEGRWDDEPLPAREASRPEPPRPGGDFWGKTVTDPYGLEGTNP